MKSNLVFPLPQNIQEAITIKFDGNFDPQNQASIQHFVGQRFALENMFPAEIATPYYEQLIQSGSLDQLLVQAGWTKPEPVEGEAPEVAAE